MAKNVKSIKQSKKEGRDKLLTILLSLIAISLLFQLPAIIDLLQSITHLTTYDTYELIVFFITILSLWGTIKWKRLAATTLTTILILRHIIDYYQLFSFKYFEKLIQAMNGIFPHSNLGTTSIVVFILSDILLVTIWIAALKRKWHLFT